MTQIIVHQSAKGIILAADSRAVAYSSDASPRYMNVQKVFRLAPHVILATGGAGYGIPICRTFQSYVTRKGLWSLDDIAHLSIAFLRSEIQRLRREHPLLSANLDLDRVYFVLAGYTPGAAEQSFRFVLLGSEHASDTLHRIPVGHMAAIPRNLKIEYYLTRPSASEMTLDELQAHFETFLMKLAQSSEEVGPPFYFVHITESGAEIRILEGAT